MNQKNTDQAGFTIIELLFFVVISAALIIIPIRLLSGRSRDVQFTDATRTIQAQMQRQYNNTLNGIKVGGENCSASLPSGRDLASNPSESDYQKPVSYDFSGSSNDGSCVFLGTLVEFASVRDGSSNVGDDVRGVMTTYEVIGANLTPAELDHCIDEVLPSIKSSAKRSRAAMFCMQPTFRKVDETKMLWGLEITKVGHHGNNGLAFIKDPSLDRTYPVGFKDEYKASEYNANKGYLQFRDDYGKADDDTHKLDVDVEYSGFVCFGVAGGSAAETAELGLGSLSKQEVIELEYQTSSCPPV